QWAQVAASHQLRINPKFSSTSGGLASDYDGFCTTYAGVATAPGALKLRTLAKKTLVILDEVHHAGDAKSWGEAVRLAFTPAVRRMSLTGTPFRSDEHPIPFAIYEPLGNGTSRSVADFTYGYADGLADAVVRPVLFMAYSGDARWRTKAGDEIEMRLGDVGLAEQTQRAWNTALDPHGDWIAAVLRAADRRLMQLRRDGAPDAGGLVIASDQASARAYADLLEHITGQKPALVLSDDRGSSARIAAFGSSTEPWIVAVRMVSEGVDLPRLGVLVYATNVGTPMFFAQAVGRVIRARRSRETATVFLPSIARLRVLASQMEAERDHVLGAPKHPSVWDADDVRPLSDEGEQPEGAYEALGASADFDDVIFDGSTWGSAADQEDEQEFLGIPGLLEASQVTALLRERQDKQLKKAMRPARASIADELPTHRAHHEVIAGLRRELNSLVSLRFQRTGQKHSLTHAQLRRVCGGPPASLANAQQLHSRIEYLRTNRD
ncbi:MAG: ATP-dependent helicase, partial [Antricoccus sp.]